MVRAKASRGQRVAEGSAPAVCASTHAKKKCVPRSVDRWPGLAVRSPASATGGGSSNISRPMVKVKTGRHGTGTAVAAGGRRNARARTRSWGTRRRALQPRPAQPHALGSHSCSVVCAGRGPASPAPPAGLTRARVLFCLSPTTPAPDTPIPLHLATTAHTHTHTRNADARPQGPALAHRWEAPPRADRRHPPQPRATMNGLPDRGADAVYEQVVSGVSVQVRWFFSPVVVGVCTCAAASRPPPTVSKKKKSFPTASPH